MKQIGTISGVPIYENPDVTDDTFYIINDKDLEVSPLL